MHSTVSGNSKSARIKTLNFDLECIIYYLYYTSFQNIDKFINESEHGVVYFSMGSFIHSRLFPKEKLDALFDAFSQIPQRIIWKWEGDPDSINSDKILVGAWMPQKDILGEKQIISQLMHTKND